MASDYQNRLVAEETLIFDATEAICEVMGRGLGVPRSDLAERIDSSPSFVSMLLNGDRTLSLRMLARMAFELGYRVEVRLLPREEAQGAS